MTLEDQKYLDILNLIMNGKHYREIAKMESVSKNTVSHMIKRLKTTGSIYPSISKKSIYDPFIKEIQERIFYYLSLRKTTYNKFHKIKLKNDEIYLLLLSEGYNISKTKTNELIRLCENTLKDNFLNIVHLPGEEIQFDWGTINIQIGDKIKSTKVWLAVFTFPYSNYRKSYVFKYGNSESFVTAFKKFTEEIGGMIPNLVIDNMKIARIFTNKNEKDVKLTRLFSSLSTHYNFNVKFCTPHRPNQKGNVENGVRILKKEFENSYINSFDNLEEVQQFMNNTTNELNLKKHPIKNDNCCNLFKHEEPRLMPLPEKEYIYYHEKEAKVTSRGYVKFQNNTYSISEMYKGEKIKVRYNNKIIYFLSMNNEIISKYTPEEKSNNKRHRIWYMLYKLNSKSSGFLNSEEYKSMSKYEKLLLNKVFKNNCRDFISFIELIKDKPKNTIKKLIIRNKDNLTINNILNHVLLI